MFPFRSVFRSISFCFLVLSRSPGPPQKAIWLGGLCLQRLVPRRNKLMNINSICARAHSIYTSKQPNNLWIWLLLNAYIAKLDFTIGSPCIKQAKSLLFTLSGNKNRFISHVSCASRLILCWLRLFAFSSPFSNSCRMWPWHVRSWRVYFFGMIVCSGRRKEQGKHQLSNSLLGKFQVISSQFQCKQH